MTLCLHCDIESFYTVPNKKIHETFYNTFTDLSEDIHGMLSFFISFCNIFAPLSEEIA